MSWSLRFSVTCLITCSSTALAQTTVQIPLNYNFNGIVHAGEAGLPDDINGYRSISDRGLDFSAGVPSDPLLSPYLVMAAPTVLDIVHLGNRNTVDSGLRAFDPAPDGDDLGVQPAWLPNPDQSGPQTTILTVPVPLDTPSRASFLYQISNGGGSFDVTFDFLSGASFTATLSGGDWFGGAYPGTGFTDSAIADNNLTITEGTIDLSGQIGEIVSQITFSNRSNLNAGYAILAANITSDPRLSTVQRVPLSYNFNGIVHTGENGLPDDPLGYRSISDRGLDFTSGVPSDALLNRYDIVDTPQTPDIVHLGNRNTVANGIWAFDPTPDGDDIGVQPAWLANPDQSGPQASVLPIPISIQANSEASLLFQISNGGGSFDVVFAYQSGNSTTATISGGDWFGGAYAGTDTTDLGISALSLSITESRIDLSADAGEILTTVLFANGSNPNAGYAILGMNITGCLSCGTPGGTTNLGGGSGPTVTTTSTGTFGCDIDATVSNAGPNAIGSMLLGFGANPIPLAAVFPACTATLNVSSPIATIPALTNAAGEFTQIFPGSPNPALCGATLYVQYGEIMIGPACAISLSDTLGITIGD